MQAHQNEKPITAPSELADASRFKMLRRLIIMGITIALLAYLLSYVDWQYLFGLLGQLSPLTMLLAFIFYVALNMFRILRYRALLMREDLPIKLFLPIGLWHNFLVRILPFKLGEVAYPYLTHRYFNLALEDAISSLFGSRLLELLMIVLILFMALLISGDVFIGLDASLIIGLGMIVILASLIGFYFAGALLRGMLMTLRHLIHGTWFDRIHQGLLALATRLDTLHHPKVFGRGIFWSFFTYGCSFAVNWVLLAGIGIDIPFATFAIIVSLGMFATAFPFSISGFGMIELGWAFGLTTFSAFTLPEATAIGFMLNGFQIASAALSGFIGYLALRYWARRLALHNRQ